MMAGRGALIKPWLFKEWADKKSHFPSPEERIAIYFKLTGITVIIISTTIN
jgi:tRNA-dihydrouridine synthase 3